ncbi:MAG: hypothetical protein ACI9JD_006208 [Rhodococcus sp. (in: high G+C Gram-positive bacteria)]
MQVAAKVNSLRAVAAASEIWRWSEPLQPNRPQAITWRIPTYRQSTP